MDPKAFRQAFNFLIQGFSAEMIHIAATKIRQLFLDNDWGAKIILIVHDEVVCEVNEKSIKEAAPKIEKCMIEAVKMCVPLEVDIGTGYSYSEAKK